MAVAEGILKVGAQLAACKFVLPVLVNWVDCVNWELVGAAVGSSGYVFFFWLVKAKKVFPDLSLWLNLAGTTQLFAQSPLWWD